MIQLPHRMQQHNGLGRGYLFFPKWASNEQTSKQGPQG